MVERAILRAPAEGVELQAEVVRLNKIVSALMHRVERSMDGDGSDFSVFQTAVMLDHEVHMRTRALQAALRENEQINDAYRLAQQQMQLEILERRQIQEMLEQEQAEQEALIKQLEDAHSQLLQSEKLASIGQLAAGVAHEINNPIGFVNSNLNTLKGYVGKLLELIAVYQSLESMLPQDTSLQQRLANAKKTSDFEYLQEDIGLLIAESIEGTSRVRRIVQDLRDFSRAGEMEWQTVDIHQGLDSTLNVVWNEIKYKAEVVKQYGELPPVECLPSQLNQVFMNLLVNAAQAIPERGQIVLRSGVRGEEVWISIADNGAGIPAHVLPRIFDPFFTTKPIGTGTGLGLSVSYGIISKLSGRIEVESQVDVGTTFTIWLPIHHRPSDDAKQAH